MKFYNRETEIETLNQINEQSKEIACFTVMIGRRRIGKTALLLHAFEGKKILYLFVSRNSEVVLCRQFQELAEEKINLKIFGTVNRFSELFEQLLIFAQQEHYTLIIDEFQEFNNINPAIFSEIQNLWDQYKSKIKLNFIVCGSIYSLMMKIFENSKEPLFGRLTSKMLIQPFRISSLKEILNEHNPECTPEDLLFLYALTGGISYYVTLLMDSKSTTHKKMLDFLVCPNSPFLNEGKELLVSEFGKDYSIYFSILQLIASGKNTQSEIDSIIEKNTGAYLVNLEKEYSLIKKSKPMFSKPQSRNARWVIDDNFLQFWFRFIYPNQMWIEIGRNDLLKQYISEHYDVYSGYLLEKYFRRKFAEEETLTAIGNFWDRKGENEIDLIALNDFDKTAVIAEIKKNPRKINLNKLTVKSAAIQDNLSEYEITFKGLSISDI